jgi:hypothetical protein
MSLAHCCRISRYRDNEIGRIPQQYSPLWNGQRAKIDRRDDSVRVSVKLEQLLWPQKA